MVRASRSATKGDVVEDLGPGARTPRTRERPRGRQSRQTDGADGADGALGTGATHPVDAAGSVDGAEDPPGPPGDPLVDRRGRARLRPSLARAGPAQLRNHPRGRPSAGCRALDHGGVETSTSLRRSAFRSSRPPAPDADGAGEPSPVTPMGLRVPPPFFGHDGPPEPPREKVLRPPPSPGQLRPRPGQCRATPVRGRPAPDADARVGPSCRGPVPSGGPGRRRGGRCRSGQTARSTAAGTTAIPPDGRYIRMPEAALRRFEQRLRIGDGWVLTGEVDAAIRQVTGPGWRRRTPSPRCLAFASTPR